MSSKNNVTGLILAGGRAQRMGGIDKGLIPFKGKPLIESAIALLQPQVEHILINANRNLEQYAKYGYPVLPDEEQNFSGPLAGFLVGLKHCTTTYMLTSPCDSPLLPSDLTVKMMTELERGGFDLVYASSKEANQKIWAQPVFCLMRRDLSGSLERFLSGGDLKIDQWFKRINASTVVFENAVAFSNVNTPEELQSLEKLSA
jgi:molybdenum cofactor guanylyltransferase